MTDLIQFFLNSGQRSLPYNLAHLALPESPLKC